MFFIPRRVFKSKEEEEVLFYLLKELHTGGIIDLRNYSDDKIWSICCTAENTMKLVKNMTSKEKVLDFIADLVCPIDPIVFAGYGSDYQKKFTECMGSEDNIQCLKITEEYIAKFLAENNQIEILDILFEFFLNKPTEYLSNLASRKSEDWDFCIHDLISRIGDKNTDITIDRLNNILENREEKRKDVIEILSFMDFRKSYGALCKIEIRFKNLSDDELEMIKDIKEQYLKFLKDGT